MVATIWLLGLVLAPAQLARPTPPVSGPASEGALSPRFERGGEMVYRGTFTEQAVDLRVRFQRSFRIEARLLVLDAQPRHTDLAAMTIFKDRGPTATGATATAVRLEKVRVDGTGQVQSLTAGGLAVPIDGPPSLEVGMFVPLPGGRLKPNQGWESRPPGEPARAWQVAGAEAVLAQNCLKLVGIQVSDEWERPRADRGAWRRTDTVWISTRTGLAVRVQRTIEQRDPASRETSRLSTLRYDLESSVRHPLPFTESYQKEVAKALELRALALPLLPHPLKMSRELTALSRKVNHYLEMQPATPYREAVLAVKRQVEAAGRGEVVVVQYHEPAKEEAPTVARVGSLAPEFLATDMTGPGSARLARFKGKAVLILFYHPTSHTAADVIRFAQSVNASLGKYVNVVGMSASDDAARVLKQRSALGATFPVLHGSGLRASYGVEATPKFIVIDASGVVRGMYLGWGSETSGEVLAELRRWLSR